MKHLWLHRGYDLKYGIIGNWYVKGKVEIIDSTDSFNRIRRKFLWVFPYTLWIEKKSNSDKLERIK